MSEFGGLRKRPNNAHPHFSQTTETTVHVSQHLAAWQSACCVKVTELVHNNEYHSCVFVVRVVNCVYM